MEIDAYWPCTAPAAGGFRFRELSSPVGGERRLGAPARIVGPDGLQDPLDEIARPENLQAGSL